MRLRMLKLSVGKGRQVIKQLCSRVLQYIRYSGYRARRVCAPRALVSYMLHSINYGNNGDAIGIKMSGRSGFYLAQTFLGGGGGGTSEVW